MPPDPSGGRARAVRAAALGRRSAAIGAALAAVLAVAGLQACAAPSLGSHPHAAAAGGPVARGAEVQPSERRGHPPLAEHFVEVGGIPLRFVERGAGDPPVVLLHGDGSMVEDFATSGVMERLATRHRAVAFDRPGYGRSERPRDRAWTPQAQAALLADAFARLGVPT